MTRPEAEQNDRLASPVFDVREWLNLTGVGDWLLNHTYTQKKVEFVVRYAAGGGATAQIVLRALPLASNASWELLAESTDHQARVVIPARTRIKW